MPFPHKFWYPRRYHQGYCDLIDSMFDDPDDSQLVETEVSLFTLLCLIAAAPVISVHLQTA